MFGWVIFGIRCIAVLVNLCPMSLPRAMELEVSPEARR